MATMPTSQGNMQKKSPACNYVAGMKVPTNEYEPAQEWLAQLKQDFMCHLHDHRLLLVCERTGAPVTSGYPPDCSEGYPIGKEEVKQLMCAMQVSLCLFLARAGPLTASYTNVPHFYLNSCRTMLLAVSLAHTTIIVLWHSFCMHASDHLTLRFDGLHLFGIQP